MTRRLNLMMLIAVAVCLASSTDGMASRDLTASSKQAMTRAVDFLVHAQQPGGEFLTQLCQGVDTAIAPPHMFRLAKQDRGVGLHFSECDPDVATAPTALILLALHRAGDARSAIAIERARVFLLAQLDARGLARYHASTEPAWAAEAPHLASTSIVRLSVEQPQRSLPSILPYLLTFQTIRGDFYPFAIPLHRIEAIMSDALERAAFTQRYGPQVVDHVQEIDPVANAVILRYFASHGAQPTLLCEVLQQFATDASVTSAYFHGNPYALAYELSLAYRDGASCLTPARKMLRAQLIREQRPDGSWGGVIHTASALGALIHFGEAGRTVDRGVQALLAQQRRDGSWARDTWWSVVDPPLRCGSEELSTGMALDVLAAYVHAAN